MASNVSRPLLERMAAGTAVSLAIAYAIATVLVRARYLGDPLGPRAFPLLVAVVLCASALWLIARPAGEAEPPFAARGPRVVAAAATFVVYGLAIEPLGFIIATAVALTLLCLLFGGDALRSAGAALGLAFALFVLFGLILNIALPAGPLALPGW